jgi:hypothetical protein
MVVMQRRTGFLQGAGFLVRFTDICKGLSIVDKAIPNHNTQKEIAKASTEARRGELAISE